MGSGTDGPARPGAGDGGLDADRLRSALERANLPTLVAVLHQLTGDGAWLRPPYAPTRGRGMDDHDDGGLPPAVQDAVRAAAHDAVLAWADGAEVAIPAPRGAELMELLSVVQGEPVPEDFEPMMAELLGFDDPAAGDASGGPPGDVGRPATGLRAAVIGAGVSGLLAALRLRELGVEVTVVEKNADVGGTWHENRYPGAGVDTPSSLYSLSFFERDWSTYFGRQGEVAGYLGDVAEAYDLRPLVRFGTRVVAATWHDTDRTWTLDLVAAEASDDGTETTDRPGSAAAPAEQLVVDILVSAVGQLNQPSVPVIPGRESFRGNVFHSAEWPDDLDLTGRRLAVVGTGASAMQIVPAVADEVEQLTVFQRSPQWVAPNGDIFRRMHPDVHWLMRTVPYYRRWYRARLAWTFNDKVHRSLQVDPQWDGDGRSVNAENDGHRRAFTRYLSAQLEGRPDLLAKCLPDYPPFGKRMLLDNGWYEALRREHVDLVDEPVERFTATTVESRSRSVEADVVVLCTGFRAHRFLAPIRVTGRGGRTLAQEWGPDDARAHLGITVPHFPNLFLLLGPNTALGHGGSMITIAELQVGYLCRTVERMAREGLAAVEVREDVAAAYNRRVDDAHAAMVWTHPAMTNWYRNAAGRVVNTLPWRIVDYREMVLRPDPADFVETPAAGRPSGGGRRGGRGAGSVVGVEGAGDGA